MIVFMYTGLNHAVFDILLGWLLPAIHVQQESLTLSNHLSSSARFLSDSHKLLLVPIHLRQNLTQKDLAFRFVVEQSIVSRVIDHWVPLPAYNLRGLIQWPETTVGPTNAPYITICQIQ